MMYQVLLGAFEKICVLVTITYVASRWEPVARLLLQISKPKDKLIAFFFFGSLAIAEVLLSRGNSTLVARVVAATAAGLFGGTYLGLSVGCVTGLACAMILGPDAKLDVLPALIGGALGGWVFSYKSDYWPRILAGFLAGALSHGAWLALVLSEEFLQASWSWDAIAVQYALPMAVTGAGVSLFLIMIGDMRAERERIERSELARAMGLANRVLPRTGVGLIEAKAEQIAEMIRLLTGLPAVSITSTEQVLAHVGQGSEHHGAGDDIPGIGAAAIKAAETCLAEKKGSFCARRDCPLTSAAACAINYEGRVVGSVVMFQTLGTRIQPEVANLGSEIAQFLVNNQMRMAEIAQQAEAVSRSELKALQAQVHPHFLFNALNTIAALCEVDSAAAGALTVKLGEFFRSSFRTDHGILSSLKEELASVRSYLDIERARFGDRIIIEEDVDPAALNCWLPSFTLQPLVENAILHGISKRVGMRKLRVVVRAKAERLVVWVVDDGRGFDPRAVKWEESRDHALGMLKKRLDRIYGNDYGFRIRSRPGEGTVACIWVTVRRD